jgi:hypothetical protein
LQKLNFKMKFSRSNFKKELTLVKKALESEEGEKEIRKFLNPLVDSVVKKYIKDYKIKHQTDLTYKFNELEQAGWKYLDFALIKYLERIEDENKDYLFTQYFTWFIRQGVHEYTIIEVE